MDFSFSPEEEAFRKQVHEFLEREATAEVREEREGVWVGPHTWVLVRKLGEKGWLCPAWPKEYGGLGLSHIYRFILEEALDYFWVLPAGRLVGTSMAGPTIMIYGTEEQKREYLPRIARGEIEFALGYSEPEAGSDLASLQIYAEDAGDYFIINGQKIFNTRCHYSQYHWLAARTDRMAPRHRGISLIIVDLSSPGITLRPLWTVSGARTNEVFYDNVKVPKGNLVGDKNKGFYYIMTALEFERTFPASSVRRIVEELVEFLKEEENHKTPVIRSKVAELYIESEVAYLYSLHVAWLISKRIAPSYEASALKVFVTELKQRVAQVGTEVLGLYAQLKKDSKWAPLKGRVEHLYCECLMDTIVGGTSEIQRNIVAQRGLGLPR